MKTALKRDSLVRDKHNLGVALVSLAAQTSSMRYDAGLDRLLQCFVQVSSIRPYWGHLSRTKKRGARTAMREKKAAAAYLGGTIPEAYRCSVCGAQGVKLWREYQSFAQRLLCAAHAEEDQRASHPPGWRSPFAQGQGDQIGWLVPAVPTEQGGYWGYTSVPLAGVTWWDRLPGEAASTIGRDP